MKMSKEKTHNQLIKYAINLLERMGYKTKGNIHEKRVPEVLNCCPDTIAEKNNIRIAVECGDISSINKIEKLLIKFDEVLWVKENKIGFEFIFFKKSSADQEKINTLKDEYDKKINMIEEESKEKEAKYNEMNDFCYYIGYLFKELYNYPNYEPNMDKDIFIKIGNICRSYKKRIELLEFLKEKEVDEKVDREVFDESD